MQPTNLLLRALKELGQYLGTKLDNVRDDIRKQDRLVQIDLTASAIKKLQESGNLDIDKAVQALDRIGKSEAAKLQSLIKAINDLKEVVEDDNSETSLLQQMVRQLEQLSQTVQRSNSATGIAELKAAMQSVAAAVRENRPREQKPIDLSPVTRAVGELKATVADLARAVTGSDTRGAIGELLAAIKAQKLEVPKTIKIDEMQFRALRNVGGGGGVSEQLAARSATVANVAMAAANTEYSYTFPANTVAFQLRTRSNDVPLLVAYQTGKLPTSGDGTAYFTVPAYFVEENTGIDWSGKTIYVQTGSASQTLEVISYTA